MTLVEVLTAAVILGAGVAGLLSAASMSLRNQRGSEYRATAMCLAQEKMSEVQVAGPRDWTTRRATQGVEDRPGVAYSWTVATEALSVGSLYSVQVTVEWSAPGSSGQVQLETWLNDYKTAAMEAAKQQGTSGTPAGQAPPNR
jgi:Tfp pilus assembly protein PilV